MSDEDPDWSRLRYLPLPKVLEEFLKELKLTQDSVHRNSTQPLNGKIVLLVIRVYSVQSVLNNVHFNFI